MGKPNSDTPELRWMATQTAILKRQMWLQRLLWARLKKIAPIKGRDQGSPYHSNYAKLLERAARNERRLERGSIKFWEKSTGMFSVHTARKRRQFLRLINGGLSQ
jgi:hypothetical protein